MFNLPFRLYAFSRHKLKTIKSSKGYGIHSPFAFNLLTEVLKPETSAYYYCFDNIEKQRNHNLSDYSKITLENGKRRTISSLCKSSSTPRKDGQLLFRLGLAMNSQKIIETGTSLGFGTAYLAGFSSKATVSTIDYDNSCLKYASKNLEALHISNVHFIHNSIDQALPDILKKYGSIDYIFYDGNHTSTATLDYFHMALPYTHAQSVFVFHDIHWSKDMYKAWGCIIKDKHITLSLELYNCGIVFFDPNLNKQHFRA